ncbi:MAG: hypothetical protein GX963_08205 [Bacteroidales bacterium]|nr:hypothetical protein [Bacteroidales bacterium]
MLSAERKAHMINSLKNDYVILTDVVIETIGDISSDMYFTGELHQGDIEELASLRAAYALNMRHNPEKAVDIIEKIFELRDRYDLARAALGSHLPLNA